MKKQTTILIGVTLVAVGLALPLACESSVTGPPSAIESASARSVQFGVTPDNIDSLIQARQEQLTPDDIDRLTQAVQERLERERYR